MDRLESMEIVLAVVEAGSLSKASRHLGTPLATVSRKVTDLEAHLRTKLFSRSNRKLVLTEAGNTYVAACRRILTDIVEAERAASGEYTAPTGELVMTAPLGFGRIHLIPILKEFLQAYPDIDVRLLLNDRVVNLVEENVDAAVRVGTLKDSSLIATRLGWIRRVLVASPAYLGERGPPKTPEDLERHDCVSYGEFVTHNRWTLMRGKDEIAVPVRSRLIVGTAEAACDAARAGIGITTVFSYHVTDALAAKTLVSVLDAFEPTPRPVNLVYQSGRLLPIKLRAFLDFAVPRLKARLA
jgi:DNA-binding transcriptional LysR family regulator